MQMAFYFDQTRCIACNTCTVACKEWNGINPGPVRWRHQDTYENRNGIFSFVMSCNHCEEPACVNACSVGAISKLDNGIVLVDKSKCAGLTQCVTACPFAAPHIADDRQEPKKGEKWGIAHPVQKCTFCAGRIQNGEKPTCVESCTAYALDYGDITYIQATYRDAVRLNPADFEYAYKNNTNETKPAMFVKKARSLLITKIKE